MEVENHSRSSLTLLLPLRNFRGVCVTKSEVYCPVEFTHLIEAPVAFFLHTHPEHLISLPFLLTYAVNKTFFGKDEVLNVAIAEKAFCKNCLSFYDEEKNTETSCRAHTGNIHLIDDPRWNERQGFWDCCRARFWEKELTVGCANTYHKKDEQYVQVREEILCNSSPVCGEFEWIV